MNNTKEKNKAVATRFIKAFNTDNWDTVRELVAPNFVFHHPVGGTVQAGPEGMVASWSDFKASLPDSWHPIPVMIAEGDYVAVLLPTYGHFTGKPYHGIQPTGKWLEYGMVNIVRLEDFKLAEAWFGMDSLAEMQGMGAAPLMPPHQLSATEKTNIDLFQQTINTAGLEFDCLTSFGDVVVALGPPQFKEDTTMRKVEIYHSVNGSIKLVKSSEFVTNPPYSGDSSADTEFSRNVVKCFFKDVIIGHDLNALAKIVFSGILIHPTAMPCEASYYGINGVSNWLKTQWYAFPDLAITDYFTVAQGDIVATYWTARGTSKGNFLMLPPTGKMVEYTGAPMYRIDSGKIAEIWETRNTLAIMGQLNPDMKRGNRSH
jgi:predicted ester cyclase